MIYMIRENRVISNGIEFTETQINPSDCTCKIIEILILFNVSFKNIENRFWLGCLEMMMLF